MPNGINRVSEGSDAKKQQIEKDRIQKEIATNQAKPRCSSCGWYTDKITSPQCFGHGSGGGSGSGGSEEKASKENTTPLGGGSSSGLIDTGRQVETANAASVSASPIISISDIKFNPEVISKFLSKNLLVINNDREKGILTIQWDPNQLSLEQRSELKEELKKFVNAILKELNEFKKEKSISDDRKPVNKDKDGNFLSLSISLPTPALYDAFIEQLARKQLLPIQNVQQAKEKVVYAEGMNHFNQTPLLAKSTPAADKKSTEYEPQKIDEKKSPSIRPKTPRDGLKPKGSD